MTPRIYYKQIPGGNIDSVHLYEHLLMTRLLGDLFDAGYIPGLWGHAEAESFSDLIMFQIGAYDNSVWPLIEKSLNSPLNPSTTGLKNAISQLSSEEGTTLTANTEKLLPLLQNIHQNPFKNLDELPVPQFIPLPSQDSPSLFRPNQAEPPYHLNSLIFSLKSEDITERVVFLRFAPVLGDIATHFLTKHGLRLDQLTGPAANNDNRPYITIDFYSNKDESTLITELTNYLTSLDLSNQKPALEKYIHSFANSSELAAFFPVDYYRDSSILTSRPLIAKSFTPANIQKILRNLHLNKINNPPLNQTITNS